MSDGQAWDAEIELRKEPFRVKVGDHIFEFEPELEADRFLEAYGKVRTVQQKAAALEATKREDGTIGIDTDDLRDLMDANRDYLATLMLPDSARRFADVPLPDRVLTLMAERVMEHYGDRPTGPSNVSPAGRSTGGRSSTGRSR